MIIRTVHDTENFYTMISNLTLQNTILKPDELGVLCHCLSHAEHWIFHNNVLAKHFGVTDDAMRKILKNLEKKDILKPLEENLKRLRSLKGLSRKKIAEELNTPYSTYAGWENGFREPDISTLNNIASYYKVSINDLLNPEAAVRDEDTLKLISRLSKNLFETYISVPDEHRAELEKKLIAYMNEFKSQKKIK